MPLVGCSSLVPFLVSPLGPSLLACLVCPSCLIVSSVRPLFVSSALPRVRCLPHLLVFLVVSSVRILPRIAWLPVPSDKRGGEKPQSTAGVSAGEWRRLLAFLGWRREVIGYGWQRAAGGYRWRMADGCESWLLACPGGDGRGGSVISSPHLIGSSNRLRLPRVIQSAWLPGHPIDGEVAFFSFSPDPLPPALLGLLAWACSPVPGRGMCWLRYGLRRRACGLLACVLISRSALSLPLVRSLLYASCRSCRCAYPGRCGAFYGLFLPLTCRRWRF